MPPKIPGLRKRPANKVRQANLKKSPVIAGSDGQRDYSSMDEFWREMGDTWYETVEAHWKAEEANVKGVLGGLDHTHTPDINASRCFLKRLQRLPSAPKFCSALDCGAGVGRVSGSVLLDNFDIVDLLEGNRRLLEVAKKRLFKSETRGRARRFICSSLQIFKPKPELRYDVIWIQWVFLHLTDEDLVKFLKTCQICLKNGGFVCIKDNAVIRGGFEVNRDDNSIARTDSHYKELFAKAGLKLCLETRQTKWPSDLIPVKMYALQKNQA